MSLPDAVSRISAIQSDLAALTTGTIAPAAATTTAAPPATGATSAAAPASFASTLTQAQSALPPAAVEMLTSGQQRFATRLAAQTGLDSRVIAAWLLSEESGSAAQTRESANNNNWLNIGYTDSGTFGASASIWSSPETAADATAGWLKGQNTVPGYGHASAGIRAILSTAGQSPEAQVSALQRSGWASSGYPNMLALLAQVSR